MPGKPALSIVQKYHPNVKRLVDAKRPIEITVTADDCRNAKKGQPSQCAMARAFSREFDGAVISKAVSYLIKGNTAYRYITPQSVVREIVSFDRHQDFTPGEYGLNSPSKSNSLAGQRNARHEARLAQPVRKSHLMKPPTQPLGKRHGAESPGGHKPESGIRKYHHKTAGVRSL